MEVTIEQIGATDPSAVAKQRMAVRQALDPDTNPDILRILATQQDWNLRQTIASNPNTPTDLLWQLGVDFPEAILANPIFELLQLEHLDLAAQIPHGTLTSLLQSDRAPIAFMSHAVNQQDYSLWLAVAYNRNAPSNLLAALAQKSRYQDRELLRAVAAHPHTSPQLLAEISELSNSLAQIVAENPHTPFTLLQQILAKYQQTCPTIGTLISLHPQLTVSRSIELQLAPTVAAGRSLWKAKQPTTTTIELAELAQTDWNVQQLAVVRNPHTPTEVVDRIWTQMQTDRVTKQGSEQKNRLIYDSFVSNPHVSTRLRSQLRKLLQW